ncbi:hypothetical protein RO3G_10656 [Rhizopus delemar RA 99-880]|uniref:Reverse transcriptase domain-containing protein n=1 Tax=Rhizopus delemar (strain RA 99-880 / ATCC MYA-4621 / FGSC 9543 / NRRL 43880) TaxID=246409 RepID=I1CBW6_RHIO9|nr:hypothetical protein RO3G_10656 [Rhizopus delemar RA 99-880]|eukprot:EIE85946.1 hypothetical protein RO3G_10656 [Rhizopus delemar RA 99-880]
MSAAETVDQYVERFNNLRRLAQIQNRYALTRCFLIGLQADIHKKVIVSLANFCRIANAIHTSAGSSMVNDSTSGRKKTSAFVSGSAARGTPCPRVSKKCCNLHKANNHSNDECHAVKKASSCSSSTRVDVSSSSATCQRNSRNLPSGLGRPCHFCGADNCHPNYPFEPLASSLSSLISSGNDTSVSVGYSATSTAGSSNASSGRKTDAAGPVVPVPDSSDDMDIDVAKVLTVIEAAQAFPIHNPGSIKLGHDSSSTSSELTGSDSNTSIPMSSHCNLPGAIITLDTEPNAFAYRRQPDIAIANRKIMEDQIQTWLDDCVIEPAPSNTCFNNPIFLVGKKDINGLYTKKRAVIDPRMLNQLVKNVDRMPLPLISDLHQCIGSATIFTTFDIRACFHHFLIQESERPKNSFTHPFTGMQYQFRHCPFGLASTDLPYTAV